uniref:Bifunctional inhibitor/plant lipid transfer protein/seed storage helical domain-containing protein n=1 Tax=Nelumbo nucifera TaxID=4432 RepID=A0A822Z6Z0_NELNU|nr:TPA_asm: hypothetical protein HUJ06_000364 [Nelumbo nucifera]
MASRGSYHATLGVWYVLVLMMVGSVRPDVAQDRSECANQLIGLSTCLPYVGGEAKAPTLDCCTGLKQILDKSKKCLCILVKDRNDPDLGLKINATLALSLPTTCHAPANVSDCPALLHLAPNSPEAQVFEQFAKGAGSTVASGGNSSSSSTATGSSAKEASDGGRGKRWMAVEMVGGVFFFCLSSFFIVGF